jgi:hypothetical protein
VMGGTRNTASIQSIIRTALLVSCRDKMLKGCYAVVFLSSPEKAEKCI